jgi:hypothetical protein
MRIVSACRYCLATERLKRTAMTALIVGTVLTLLNQGDVVAGGEATSITYMKCTANYLVPFVVSNVGLLIGRSAHDTVGGSVGRPRLRPRHTPSRSD